MLHGIIDIGSNSIRLVVYEVNAEAGTFDIVYDKKHMAGLAGFVDNNRRLTDKGVKRAIECIQSHLSHCETMGLSKDSVSVFATASIRNTVNCWEVCKAIDTVCGTEISLLSSATEARTGFQGALLGITADSGVVIDIGGGSTEVTRFENRKPVCSISLPYGSLNMFVGQVDGLLPDQREIYTIKKIIRANLENVDGFYGYKCRTVYGIGGTARGTAKLAQDLYYDGTPNPTTTASQMRKMLDKAGEGSKDILLRVLSVSPERVHTIFPGMAIESAIVEFFGAEHVEVVRHGIREGYLMNFVMGKTVE